MSQLDPLDPTTAERERLLQFTRVLITLSIGFAVGEVLLAAIVRSTRLVGTSLIMALFSAAVLLARRWIRVGRQTAAVRLIEVGLLLVAVTCEWLAPFCTATLLLVPLVAFAVVLSLLGRSLTGALVRCFCAELALLILSHYLPIEATETWQRLLGASSFVAGVVLVLLLLRQQGDRQSQAIESLRSAYRSLRASEDLYRQLVEAAAEGIWRGDSAARTSFVNGRMAGLLGYAPDDMLGQPVDRYVAPESQRAAEALVQRHQAGAAERQELVLRRRDGTSLRVSVGAVPVRDGTGRYSGFLWMVTDVTELAQLHSQLMFADRMASVGNLAGGVAHDFNNLLTIIIGQAELLAAHLVANPRESERVAQVVKAARRAAELTSQLLAFGRKQLLHPTALSLNALARGLEGLLRSALGEQIAFAFALDPDVGSVHADQGQLERVLINLVLNARDAMPAGGRLELRTRRAVVDAGAGLDEARGTYATISVTDTGCGMDEATRARLFEPFFTTKPVGVGTGLGLSTVYGIVKQSGGHITVESAPGRGSTFTIYLPRIAAAPDVTLPAEIFPAPAEQHGTLLLVEDNDDLRELISQVLGDGGYQVLPAAGGQQALELSRRHRGPIDLILTDLMMPHLDGATLTRRIHEERSGVPVLYMSGYAAGSGAAPGAFLRKPFSTDELLARVREVLASSRPGA